MGNNDRPGLAQLPQSFFNLRRATVFQSPLWMDLIHRRLAPNLSARQYTITIRRPENGALLVVLPTVVQQASVLQVLQPVPEQLTTSAENPSRYPSWCCG